MILECDATFQETLTCGLENDMRNLAHESLKTGTFIGSFYTKQKIYELKTYREVTCYVNEE